MCWLRTDDLAAAGKQLGLSIRLVELKNPKDFGAGIAQGYSREDGTMAPSER
jgi:hypothetical protein